MAEKGDAWKVVIRPLGVPLIGEGIAMLCCLLPALHFDDGTAIPIALSGALTVLVGLSLLWLVPRRSSSDKRLSYIMVALIWLVMALFGVLPFMVTGSCMQFTNAFFESMSGLTSSGATIFNDIESLPPSVLLWRSVLQWMGGFGIILLVLAVVPSLGLNKYSLYTAEMSGADNTAKTTTSTRAMVQRTLSVYILLTLLFIIVLHFTGMTMWEAVNITFTNISTGGFSIYGDSIARFTPVQQYVLAVCMFLGGINFALLYNFFTFKWDLIRNKLDQFGFYVSMLAVSIAFVCLVLVRHDGLVWHEALRLSTVQIISVMTTTGVVVTDTNLWWTPVLFLMLILSVCGGMAGSTSGGVKTMRVIILLRNVRNALTNRLHPHAVNPVRLNGKPVSNDIITNVMVIFVVYAITMMLAFVLLMLSGVPATESLGAVFGCITSYGPGLGSCGGFGSYESFPLISKWICSALMMLGRLECLTVYILFLPGFWRSR